MLNLTKFFLKYKLYNLYKYIHIYLIYLTKTPGIFVLIKLTNMIGQFLYQYFYRVLIVQYVQYCKYCTYSIIRGTRVFN